jgi:hypothetical protein
MVKTRYLNFRIFITAFKSRGYFSKISKEQVAGRSPLEDQAGLLLHRRGARAKPMDSSPSLFSSLSILLLILTICQDHLVNIISTNNTSPKIAPIEFGINLLVNHRVAAPIAFHGEPLASN